MVLFQLENAVKLHYSCLSLPCWLNVVSDVSPFTAACILNGEPERESSTLFVLG